MLCKQPRTRILKCAVCAAPPVHPGFAASWEPGCQDTSLEDNENICCFSTKTYSNNRHGDKQNPDCRAGTSCLSHSSEGFGSSSSLRWVLSTQSLPCQPRSCLCLPSWGCLSRESALGAAGGAAPPWPEEPRFSPSNAPALHCISRAAFQIAFRSSSKARTRELRPLPSTSQWPLPRQRLQHLMLGISGQWACGHFLSSLQQCCLTDLGFISMNEHVPSRIPGRAVQQGLSQGFAGLPKGCSMQELSQAAQGQGEATELFALGSQVLLQEQWKFILLRETAASGAKEPLQRRKQDTDRFRWRSKPRGMRSQYSPTEQMSVKWSSPSSA